MTDLHVPGAKDDSEKVPMSLLFESFPRALLEVTKVAAFGAKKYTRNGWKAVPNATERYTDAKIRHLLFRYIEGDHDKESELLHYAHEAWNALAILELYLKENSDG